LRIEAVNRQKTLTQWDPMH